MACKTCGVATPPWGEAKRERSRCSGECRQTHSHLGAVERLLPEILAHKGAKTAALLDLRARLIRAANRIPPPNVGQRDDLGRFRVAS